MWSEDRERDETHTRCSARRFSVSAPAFALAAEGDQQSSRGERMQQWAADRETMLDAKLAGMKAGLGLTADQEKLWGPFESAVKDADNRAWTRWADDADARAGRAHVARRPS